MNLIKSFFLCVLLVSSSANAMSEGHIITAGSSSALVFAKGWDNSYDAYFNLDTGYDYAFTNGYQAGASLNASIASGRSSWSLGFGPTYNFSHNDIENSYYVGATAGLNYYNFGSNSDTDGFVSVKGGKRFKLMDHVSYTPKLEVHQALVSGADPIITLLLFNLSVLF
ncbi:MAG: hypothetical protein WC635_06030 [Bacteriovorax sp.]|jgi:hypothetical protein